MMIERLKTILSWDNAKQASTIKAICGFIFATILINVSPDQQQAYTDAATAALMSTILGVKGLFAAYHYIIAIINLWHDEKKQVIVTNNNPTGGK